MLAGVQAGGARRWCGHRHPVNPRVPPLTFTVNTMRYWWTVLLFVVLLIPIIEMNTPGQPRHCATVYALGYDGERGISIPITTCVGSGNGKVFVSTEGTMSESFQNAIHTAYAILSSRYDVRNKNIYITVSGPAVLLQGESAGAAIYASMFAAVAGLNPKKLAASGVISNNGTVEQVLYAREKASAFNGEVLLPVTSCVKGAKCVQTVKDIEDAVQSQSV